MSARKPTIDGADDVDDEDGIAEEEVTQETDLTLHPKEPENLGMSHRPPEAGDPYVTDDGREDER